MDELITYMNSQLKALDVKFRRYAHDTVNWECRMLGLLGPRGVGKTTLFLQKVQEIDDPMRALYVSADHSYFAVNTLFDLADEYYKMGGETLYIDEIHNYENWSRELKMIYDGVPKLKVRFTGSSALNILQGECDLSRRAPIFKMQGLSFREFLSLKTGKEFRAYSLDEIVNNRVELNEIDRPLALFREYLTRGYYPFFDFPGFENRIEQIVTSTLQFDIPQVSNMSVSSGRKLKKMMMAIARAVPFKPNISKLAGQIGVSRPTAEEYLTYMQDAQMICALNNASNRFGNFAKAEKIYLDNTSLMNVLCPMNSNTVPKDGTIRETFFLNQMRVNNDVVASGVSDFQIEGMTFEVGGKNKTGKQIAGVSDSFIVRDDIEYGFGNVVPLWCFGMNY